MNLFQVLRRSYGQGTVKLLRNCENIEKKTSCFRNHRVFTLRCRDQGLTPPSLRLKCPINTQKARDIIKKAEKDLLRERIRVINNKIDYLDRKKSELNRDLNSRDFPSDTKQSIVQHLAKTREKTFQDVRARQQRKYDRLVEKSEHSRTDKTDSRDRNKELDLSGSQLKKWVVNLSRYKVTSAQEKALSRGLNFAVAPENVNEASITNECIIACEKACWKLPISEASQLRSEVVGAIKSAKPPKSNISKDERNAIKELQNEKSVKILGADKGRATVIMDTQEYEEKLAKMLSDNDTYVKLDKDPTPKYKKQLVDILSRLEKEGKITPEDKKFLYPTAEIIPRIYGSPKIHKKDNPLRPIIDYTGSIGYNVSRSLADIISPLVGKSDHNVLNSKQLADDLKDFIIGDDEMLLSHDVVSLFTNTPIELTLKIIREKLEQDKSLHLRTRLSVNDLMELVQFILTTTYFTSKGTIYQQKKGAAMGSPLSPIAVDLFMEWLEDKELSRPRPKIANPGYGKDTLTMCSRS